MTRCGSCWLECFDYLLPDYKGSMFSWIIFVAMTVVFVYLFVKMVSSMLNSPIVGPKSYRSPYQYTEYDIDEIISDPLDSTNGIFSFIQISDLHISEKSPSHAEYVKDILTNARDIMNPAFIAFSGDLVDAFNIGFSQGEGDWIGYGKILDEFNINDPDILIDLKGNHDVYGISSQVSPSNFYCKYSVIANNDEPDNYLYKTCQKWKEMRENVEENEEEISRLTITYDDEYKTHIYIKDLEVIDNIEHEGDSEITPHVYRFLGIDYTPVPSPPFPMNFLVQIPTEFVNEIYEKKVERDGTSDNETRAGYSISTTVVSHYSGSQISVVSDDTYMGKSMLLSTLDQINANVILTGHEHVMALACNSDPIIEIELVHAYADDYNSRLFVYDNYGQTLSFFNIPKNVTNRPLPVILFPPHSSFPISDEMAFLTELRSMIRVLIYLDDFMYDQEDNDSIDTFKNVVENVTVKAFIYYPENTLLTTVELSPKMEEGDNTLPELLKVPLLNKFDENGNKTTKLAALDKNNDRIHALLYTGDWNAVLNMVPDRNEITDGYIKIIAHYNRDNVSGVTETMRKNQIKNSEELNDDDNNNFEDHNGYGTVLQPFSFGGHTTKSNWFDELRGKADEEDLIAQKFTVNNNDNSNKYERDENILFGGRRVYKAIATNLDETSNSNEDNRIVLEALNSYSYDIDDESNILNINMLPLYNSRPGFDILNWVDKIIYKGDNYRATYYSLTLVLFLLTFFVSLSRLISFFILDKRSVSFRFIGKRGRRFPTDEKRNFRNSISFGDNRYSINGFMEDDKIICVDNNINDLNSDNEFDFIIPVRKRSFSVVPLLRNPFQFCLSVLSLILLILGALMVLTTDISGYHEESAFIFMKYFGSSKIRVVSPEITTINGAEEEIIYQVDGNLYMLAIIFGGLSLCYIDGASLVFILLSYFRLRTDWENIPMSIRKNYKTRNMINKATGGVTYGFSLQSVDNDYMNESEGRNNIDSPPCIKKVKVEKRSPHNSSKLTIETKNEEDSNFYRRNRKEQNAENSDDTDRSELNRRNIFINHCNSDSEESLAKNYNCLPSPMSGLEDQKSCEFDNIKCSSKRFFQDTDKSFDSYDNEEEKSLECSDTDNNKGEEYFSHKKTISFTDEHSYGYLEYALRRFIGNDKFKKDEKNDDTSNISANNNNLTHQNALQLVPKYDLKVNNEAKIKRNSSSICIGKMFSSQQDPMTDGTDFVAEEIIGSPNNIEGKNNKYEPDIINFTKNCGLCMDKYCCCICCDCSNCKHCTNIGRVLNYEFWSLCLGFIQFNLVSFTSALYMSLRVWTSLDVDLDTWYLAINIVTVLIMILSIIIYFLFNDNQKKIKNKPLNLLVSFLVISIICQMFTQYFVGVNIIVPKLYTQNNITMGMIMCVIQEVIIYVTFTAIDIIILIVLRIVIVKYNIEYVVPIKRKQS